MKYIISILLLFSIVTLPCISKVKTHMFVNAQGQKIKYALDENKKEAIILGGEKFYKDCSYIIPEEIDGYKVTKIGNDAFKECENVHHIELPSSIRTFADGAFENLCFDEFYFPENLQSSESGAFSWGCLSELDYIICIAAGRTYSNPKLLGEYKLYKYEDGHILFKNNVTGKVHAVKTIYDIDHFLEEDVSCENRTILTKVETSVDPENRYGDIKEIKTDTATAYSFKDEYVEVHLSFLRSYFYISIKNVGTNTVKVVWDEATFVDPQGKSTPILEGETRLIHDNLSNKSTVIIRNATYEGYIFAKSYFDPEKRQYRDLLPVD